MSGERVCMLVRNDCRTDYRVLKEAGSVARAGYRVTVVAVNTYGPLERERRDGFEIVRVPVERAPTKAGRYVNLFPRAMWRMAEVARQVGATIYHAHDADATVPAWLAARRVPGAKLLYDAHEVGFMTFREMLQYVNNLWLAIPSLASTLMWESLFDWIIRNKIDAMITVNEPLADLHAEHYHRPRPEVVMNCPPRFAPASESRYLLAQKIGVDAQTPIVIYQGMLVRDRHGVGLENLIRSAPLLRRGVVVILGRGSQAEELRALAAQPEITGRVFVLPAVPPNELLSYTAGASIGVIPTEFWLPTLRFSSPNKLFEYLAVGLPVVTSDLPVIRSICDSYGCGLICDPTSPASIADALNRLLDDPELYQRMHNGALAAAQVYNWEAQEQVLLDVYRRLLADPASQSATVNRKSAIS